MLNIIVTLRGGEVRSIAAALGHSVMETIRDAGIDEILALCGGCCSCATCHVYVDPEYMGRLPPMNNEQDDLLSGSDFRRENSRLACQIPITEMLSDMKVTIAPGD